MWNESDEYRCSMQFSKKNIEKQVCWLSSCLHCRSSREHIYCEFPEFIPDCYSYYSWFNAVFNEKQQFHSFQKYQMNQILQIFNLKRKFGLRHDFEDIFSVYDPSTIHKISIRKFIVFTRNTISKIAKQSVKTIHIIFPTSNY